LLEHRIHIRQLANGSSNEKCLRLERINGEIVPIAIGIVRASDSYPPVGGRQFK